MRSRDENQHTLFSAMRVLGVIADCSRVPQHPRSTSPMLVLVPYENETLQTQHSVLFLIVVDNTPHRVVDEPVHDRLLDFSPDANPQKLL